MVTWQSELRHGQAVPYVHGCDKWEYVSLVEVTEIKKVWWLREIQPVRHHILCYFATVGKVGWIIKDQKLYFYLKVNWYMFIIRLYLMFTRNPCSWRKLTSIIGVELSAMTKLQWNMHHSPKSRVRDWVPNITGQAINCSEAQAILLILSIR